MLFSRIKSLAKNIFRQLLKNNTSTKCLLGGGSYLSAESAIENFSNDIKKIMIGSHCYIRGRLIVYAHAGGISIGNYFYIGERTNIWSAESIKIGNNVLIAHDVDIHDSNDHPIDSELRHKHYKDIITTGHPKEDLAIDSKAIHIQDNVWIGFKSIILKGVTIGEGAIIAAGSVVTKNVEPWTVVAGNPASVVKKLK